MGEFFAGDYHGAPFELFGTAHLAALAVVALVNLYLLHFRRWAGEAARRAFRYGLAAILLIDEAAWHWWHVSIGRWTVQELLPLHLCSLFVFLSAIMLVSKSYAIYEYAYFLGIGGAMQALLTPDAGMYGFPHFRFFQVFVSHGSIVTAAVYMTLVEGYRPTWKSLGRVAVGANLYMLAIGAVNYFLGSNYLFIAHKPATPSLLDVLGPWPWYILSMEGIGLVLCLLLYLPFYLKDVTVQP
ncbi:MAG: TIGR02206 family membrane protein [Caldilineae bacterium]|nr:MAG: TIGR02206 family membrane protein [Caldilineae bacterium]